MRRHSCFILNLLMVAEMNITVNQGIMFFLLVRSYGNKEGTHRFDCLNKPVAPQSEIGNLAGLELQGKLVCDKRNKFRIRGFSLGIADSIAEKSLQSVQIPSVPGNLDGMADGPLHTAGGGLECFCHLGVQYFCDGVDDVHVVDGNDDSFPQILIAFDVGRDADLFIALFMALMLSCLLSYSHYSKNRKPAQGPIVPMLISCSYSENVAAVDVSPLGILRKALFLRVWGRDFVLAEDLGRPEYSMYCGLSEQHSQGERSSQSAKGELFCGGQLHRRQALSLTWTKQRVSLYRVPLKMSIIISCGQHIHGFHIS